MFFALAILSNIKKPFIPLIFKKLLSQAFFTKLSTQKMSNSFNVCVLVIFRLEKYVFLNLNRHIFAAAA